MKKRMLISLLVLISGMLSGQGRYEFSQYTDTYVPLDNPFFERNNITPGSAYGLSLSGNWAPAFGIEFELGAPTPLGVAGNGAVFLSDFQDSLVAYIFGFHGVLRDIDSNSYVAAQLTGQPGTGIYKIEYHRVGFQNSDTSNHVSFQIWISQPDSAIEIRIGPSSLDSYNDPVEIGLMLTDFPNPTSEVLDAYMLTGDAANPEISRTDSFIALDNYPADGTVYRFEWTTDPTGIEKPVKEEITLYPNPAQTVVRFTGAERIEQIEGYDVSGRQVIRSVGQPSGELKIEYLPEGIYILRILTDDGWISRKLVKNR